MIYELLINLDNDYWSGYANGEKLVFSYRGHVDTDADNIEGTLEAIFARHNSDDRPDGQMNPSLSIGDVVRLWFSPDEATHWKARKTEWLAWTPTRIGWQQATVLRHNIERNIPWTALVHTNKRGT